MKIYAFDIDGTLCSSVENSRYESALPFKDMIDHVNDLYDKGHRIKIFTARGSVSGKDWTEFTESQLKGWGLKYHELITNSKPHFDVLIDDKAINAVDYRKLLTKKVGFCASTFDIIHPGYAIMLKEAKDLCDYLVVGLHVDANEERKEKNRPVQSVEERKIVLSSIRYVDEIIEYRTEKDLRDILVSLKPDIRIIGSDWQNKDYTAKDLNIKIHWHKRDHNWSASGLRSKIFDAELSKRETK
jgi:glycerol-3-phosphate cytidylyltransferase